MLTLRGKPEKISPVLRSHTHIWRIYETKQYKRKINGNCLSIDSRSFHRGSRIDLFLPIYKWIPGIQRNWCLEVPVGNKMETNKWYLWNFSNDFRKHLRDRRCAAHRCSGWNFDGNLFSTLLSEKTI